MSEKVDVLAQDGVSVTIMNLIAEDSWREDFLQKYNMEQGNSIVTVAMQVNGVEVPVRKFLEDYWKRFDSLVEEQARNKAKEMVSELGLEKIAEAIQDLKQQVEMKSWNIIDSIENWKEKK